MPMQEQPIVGALYEDTDGLKFEVTGFDEDEGAVEIRYDDGSVDALDIDTWYEMELRRLKADGEWAGDEDEDDEDVRPTETEDEDGPEDDEDEYDDEEEEE